MIVYESFLDAMLLARIFCEDIIFNRDKNNVVFLKKSTLFSDSLHWKIVVSHVSKFVLIFIRLTVKQIKKQLTVH